MLFAIRSSVLRVFLTTLNLLTITTAYGWKILPSLILSEEFSRNRFALSVGAGTVRFRKTKFHDNVFGLYLSKGSTFDGDSLSVKGNLEADIRRESDELAGQGRRVSRSVWQRIEAGF